MREQKGKRVIDVEDKEKQKVEDGWRAWRRRGNMKKQEQPFCACALLDRVR